MKGTYRIGLFNHTWELLNGELEEGVLLHDFLTGSSNSTSDINDLRSLWQRFPREPSRDDGRILRRRHMTHGHLEPDTLVLVTRGVEVIEVALRLEEPQAR